MARNCIPVLEHVARSPEGEASAIRAAFPDLAAPRLESALTHLGERLHMLHPVGAAGSGFRAAERWRIASPLLRFWVNAGMARLVHELPRRNRHREERGLADRMETTEQAALEELKRDCGDDWPDIPDPVPNSPRPGKRRLGPIRSAHASMRGRGADIRTSSNSRRAARFRSRCRAVRDHPQFPVILSRLTIAPSMSNSAGGIP